jgi:ABC-type cobalamin/Fe3+-siderophores transport system ATPase subunit
MHVSKVELEKFKGFEKLQLTGLPPAAKLVVLIGPNGVGKSSIFDAFHNWGRRQLGLSLGYDGLYYNRGMEANYETASTLIEFHEPIPLDQEFRKRIFCIRSAYRNEADFSITQISALGKLSDQFAVQRLIDPDSSVSRNYRWLVGLTTARLFDGSRDQMRVSELRNELIGRVRDSFQRIYPDLELQGISNPLSSGTFTFKKSNGVIFQYKNLSGGEKAVFDLLLDLVVRTSEFTDTVFCIDEPETHLSTRIQASTLEQLVSLVPERCQLWIATHSIGMLRKAMELHSSTPENIAFIDFSSAKFDGSCTLKPTVPSKAFWLSALNTSMDDLHKLVVPKLLVLVEGSIGNSERAKFDAQCYNTIFQEEYPEVLFISLGNSHDVATPNPLVKYLLGEIAPHSTVVHVIDRDGRSDTEVSELKSQSVRVLTRRHIESYLFDDEVLVELAATASQPQNAQNLLDAKREAISNSIARGNLPDDLKSASGEIFNTAKTILKLTNPGNSKDAFKRDTLAPLLRNCSATYLALKNDIFGT